MVSDEIRKKAVDMDAQFHLGKEGITNNFLKSINEYLEAHELVKIRAKIATDKNSLEYYSGAVAEELDAEVCFKRGSTFALYRRKKD